MTNFFQDLIRGVKETILPSTPMAFPVGEGLTVEQKQLAQEKITSTGNFFADLPELGGMTLTQAAGISASPQAPSELRKEASKIALEKTSEMVLGIAGGLEKKVLKPLVKPITEKIIAGTKRYAPEVQDVVTSVSKQLKSELESIRGETLTHEEVLSAAKNSEVLTKVTSREATLKREAALLKTRQNLAALSEGKGVNQDFIDNLQVISSEASNLGRQLNALKIEAQPELATSKQQLVKTLLDAGVETEKIIKAAEGVDFNNAKQVQDLYRQFIKPKFSEIIDEYRYINLLSSPRTHIVNSFSNLLQGSVVSPATKLYSGIIDNVASGIGGKAQQHYISEVPAYYRGFFNATGDAVRGAFDALKGQSNISRPDLSRIPTGSKILAPFQIIPRALEAGDIFFRTLIKAGEKEALMTKALKQGKELDGAALAKIDQDSIDNASYYVFRQALDPSNKTGQGKILSGIDKLTNSIYNFRNVPGVKWFIPFVQTPMNILKQGLEYSPLGVSTLPGNIKKTEQIAKAMLGSTVMLGAAYIAQKGDSTWDIPKDTRQKELFYASGRQPFSLKIGDTWVSYSKLGPLAYPMAMAAAMRYYHEQSPTALTDTELQKMGKVLAGTAQFFSGQSYVEGIKDIVDVVQGNTGSAAATLANIPSQLVPLASLQRWIANIVDPIYRKTEKGLSIQSIIENIQKGIPVASKGLEPYKTPTGKPSERQMPELQAISPVGLTKEIPRFEKQLQQVELQKQKINVLKEKYKK